MASMNARAAVEEEASEAPGRFADGGGPGTLDEAEAELARLGRQEPLLRLRLGELLDALARSGGHHELGFSSLEAYALERCGQSARWCRSTRGLARRLRDRGLPSIRQALRSGRLTWSMAELLAAHGSLDDEALLLEAAASRTYREMKAWLRERLDERGAADAGASATHPASLADEEEEPEVRTARTVGVAELSMVNASRMLVEFLNGARAGDEALVTALLGEGLTTLQSLERFRIEDVVLPSVREELIEELRADLAALNARPRRSRAPADGADAPSGPRPSPAALLVGVPAEEPIPEEPHALDRALRRCCAALAEIDLEVGRLARGVLRAQAWRRLGYATAEAWARDRVGVSLSTLEHRVTLARRVALYPDLGRALRDGTLGSESALMIGRVLGDRSSPEAAAAWIERARRRTVVHLRQEVEAVLLRVGLDPHASREPPAEEHLAEVAELERGVQSGELLRTLLTAAGAGPQMSVTLRTVGPDAGGRQLRLTMSAGLYAHWVEVEEAFQRLAGEQASFVAFLCFSLWSTWLPFLEVWDDEWKAIYRRDRHRCTSPVCARHDVTPHHLEFQAHGGGDEEENVTSLCAWCHLHGIHGGRLRAAPPASEIRWSIGGAPLMEVHGRERVLLD